ncbi:MAG: tripartite tricarboxylate transporter TctB family protein [Deltaproteobacteria bacterium]|nr:tripartite tricarboxylate transporter TctB family protein [Deltaproteobacteria bacterium]
MFRSDRYSSLFFLGLAAFICWQSLAFGVGTLGQPGPGFLSFSAGVAMGLLSLVFLIGTFLKRRGSGEPSGEAKTGSRRATVITLCLSLFAYAIAVHWLGFVLATLLFVVFLFRIVETEPWWRSLTKGALVTAGNYLVFVLWLGIPLPKGIFPW